MRTILEVVRELFTPVVLENKAVGFYVEAVADEYGDDFRVWVKSRTVTDGSGNAIVQQRDLYRYLEQRARIMGRRSL